MKAKVLKEWCEENISPLAWKRIVLKVMDAIYDAGYTLSDIENPNADIKLDQKMFEKIQEAISTLYEIELMVQFQET